MLLARRLLTAGFVKKPRQHYGVVYVLIHRQKEKPPANASEGLFFLKIQPTVILINRQSHQAVWFSNRDSVAKFWEPADQSVPVELGRKDSGET
jgi:hypothetical protein